MVRDEESEDGMIELRFFGLNRLKGEWEDISPDLFGKKRSATSAFRK
jgi:hypothetical protein